LVQEERSCEYILEVKKPYDNLWELRHVLNFTCKWLQL
jgi:hypothetical protein